MTDYTLLINQIQVQIKENHNNDITGPILQAILLALLDAINLTKADSDALPTRLSQLEADSLHRLVTDVQIQAWNGKSIVTWSAHINPNPDQPIVDNHVTLTVQNGESSVPYILALGNHSHPNIPTDEQIQIWNAKSDFSGDYNDLTNKPTIIEKQQGGGKGNPIYIDANNLTKLITYLTTHPDNDGNIVIPSLFSDISFLLERGGTCNISASGWSYNSDDRALMFDSAPSYFILTKNSVPSSPSMVIQLRLPEVLYYNNFFYIDFGQAWWGAKKVRVQWGNSPDEYNPDYSHDLGIQDVEGSVFKCSILAGVGGLRDIQIVLTDWEQNAEQSRIAEIGVVNFNGAGIRGTAMSRGIDDEVWRSITPAKNNFYFLGSSQKAWANVFAQALSTLGSTLNLYKVDPSDPSHPTLLASFNGTQLDIYSGGNRVLTINASGILPASGKSLGSTTAPWDSLAINGAVGIYYNGRQFLSKWNDDFVFNYANENPTKRLLFYGALISNIAVHYYTKIDDAVATLLTLGTENISFRDFRPVNNSTKLGTRTVPWGEMHANKWFPKQGDDSIFVEFVNNRFVFNGNMIVTGYLGVGEVGASTTDQYMQFSIFPAQTNLKLGNNDYKWLEIWCKTLFAEKIGTSANRVQEAYIERLYANEIIKNDLANWTFYSQIGLGIRTFTQLGVSMDDLNAIRSGQINKIEDESEDKLFYVTQVENSPADSNLVIYFGRDLCFQQVSSSQARIDRV